MSEQQVQELAERLERADEEQYEDGAAPADPYLALAREALAYANEQKPTRPADDPEQAPVTPSEPAPSPEATQVAEGLAYAATAVTGAWRGKRWVVKAAPGAISEGQAVLAVEGDEALVMRRFAVITSYDLTKPAGPLAGYIAHLQNSSLERSAALPRERLASRWAELQVDKEQLGRAVDFFVDRLAALRPEARETARLLAQTAIERDELQRRCRWAAVRFGELGQDGCADVMLDLQPVPGGEEGRDG